MGDARIMKKLKTLEFKSNDDLDAYLGEYYPDVSLVTYPEIYEAFLGVIEGNGIALKVCYDYEKSLALLQEMLKEPEGDDDDDLSDAIEWFQFNTVGAHYGEHTPAFIHRELEV